MHYYQHHIGDFIKATARLTDAQAMAYLRLIWKYYDDERPLPDEMDVLAFQIGATEADVNLILRSYFKLENDGWHQTRCDIEIDEYHQKAEQASKAGKASAQARLNKRLTNVEQPLNGLSTNHKPITNNQEPVTKNQGNKRVTALCPQDVDAGVWEDWKQLRKSKRATVSETVINEARKEATKAGMSLNQFFKEWCLRGSQGLKAEWLTNNQSDKRTEHQKRQDASARVMLGDAYYATQTLTAIEGEVIDEKSPFTRRLG